jgi:hypothetical protein
MEAKLVLVTVLQRFHLELAPGEVVVPKFSISLRPKNSLKMVLTERRRVTYSATNLPPALPVAL